jgi:hypothetical protein
VVRTPYQHTDMSDRGPDEVKSLIQGVLADFLDDETPVNPLNPDAPAATAPKTAAPGTVALSTKR